MINIKSLKGSNIFTITTVMISTCVFYYADLISAVVSVIASFLIIRLFLFIKRKFKDGYKKLGFFLILFFIFEVISLSFFFFDKKNFPLIAVVCVLFITAKMSFVSLENIRSINQLSIVFVVAFILMLPLSLFLTVNAFDVTFSFDINIIFIIISIIFSNIVILELYEFKEKEFNIGFVVGGSIYLLIVLLQNLVFGNGYIFDIHPIIAISKLVLFPIVPFSEWFLLYLIVFRETLNLKYAYNIFRNIRRKSIETRNN